MEAHQYKIRKQKELEESTNPYWSSYDLELKNACVKPVTRKEAEKIILEYEWLKCMPSIVFHCFGLFFKSKIDNTELCGGVVVFSNEYSDNTTNWDKYGYNGKMILLSRGVCLHWTPKNSNSKLIMAAIKLLPAKYEIVTCTIDPAAGEVGTIYQACNFYYVGVMRKQATRFGVRIV